MATMVPRTQAILRALRRRCLRGSRAAIISYAAASRVIALCRGVARNRCVDGVWHSAAALLQRRAPSKADGSLDHYGCLES